MVPTKCEFALETLDYGIYKTLPFYRIYALCHNETAQGTYVVERFRSGDIVTKPPAHFTPYAEKSESYGKLTVSYSYGMGTYQSLVYRIVKDPQTDLVTKWEKYSSGKN